MAKTNAIFKRMNSVTAEQLMDQPTKPVRLGYATLRLRHASICPTENIHIDRVARLISHSSGLNLGDPNAQKGCLRTLRELQYPMQIKRLLRDKLSPTDQSDSKKGAKKSCYSFFLKGVHEIGFKSVNLSSQIQIWNDEIRKLSSQFGSNVATYFLSLRWLLFLNCALSFVSLAFLILPRIILEEESTTSFSNKTAPFYWQDMFVGDGWFKHHSGFFYDFYGPAKIESFYDTSFAYICVVWAILILSLVALSESLADMYKHNFIMDFTSTQCKFSIKIFSGWDFEIANRKSAAMRETANAIDLKEQMEFENKKQIPLNGHQVVIAFFSRIFFHILYLFILSFASYLIYMVIQEEDSSILKQLPSSLAVTTTFYVLPPIVSNLQIMESRVSRDRSRQAQIVITVVRTMTLFCMCLGVVLWHRFLYTSSDLANEGWETNLGMEFYRLALQDLLFSVLLTIPTGLFVILFKSCGKKGWQFLEFDAVMHSWYLVYGQFLCWIGVYFCPILPLIAVIKLFLLFYVQKINSKLTIPPSRPWMTRSALSVVRMLAFIGIILSLIPNIFVMFYVKPSSTCGPFLTRSPNITFQNPYDYVTWVINHSWMWIIYNFVATPGIDVLALVAFGVLVYYKRAVAKAQQEMVNQLERQIKSERKDKILLLRMLQILPKQANRNKSSMPTTIRESEEQSNGQESGIIEEDSLESQTELTTNCEVINPEQALDIVNRKTKQLQNNPITKVVTKISYINEEPKQIVQLLKINSVDNVK